MNRTKCAIICGILAIVLLLSSCIAESTDDMVTVCNIQFGMTAEEAMAAAVESKTPGIHFSENEDNDWSGKGINTKYRIVSYENIVWQGINARPFIYFDDNGHVIQFEYLILGEKGLGSEPIEKQKSWYLAQYDKVESLLIQTYGTQTYSQTMRMPVAYEIRPKHPVVHEPFDGSIRYVKYDKGTICIEHFVYLRKVTTSGYSSVEHRLGFTYFDEVLYDESAVVSNEESKGEIRLSCQKHDEQRICLSCGWTGTGMTDAICSNCRGKGSAKCSKCDGTGEQTCFVCAGRGDFQFSNGSFICSNCNGSGKDDCWNCNGSGLTECSICDGTGRTKEELEKCPNCSQILICSICRNMRGSYLKVQFDEALEEFAYRKVMRSPDDKIGQYYAVSGSIISIEEQASNAYRLVLQQTDNGISYLYEVLYFPLDGTPKLLKGDTVTVNGQFISYDKKDTPTFITADIVLHE